MRELLFTAVLMVAADVAAQEEEAVTAEEEAHAYEWFAGLGYPDLATLPFVKVYTGRFVEWRDHPPEPAPEYGFLVRDEDGRFTGKSAERVTGALPTP
jgi:hypothetical protein